MANESDAMGLWRLAQTISLALGLGEVLLLLTVPSLGIHLLWNILIPLAPLVFMVIPGVWRNVCPLGIVSQIPRHLRFQRGYRLSDRWAIASLAIGWAALLIIVPMRHLWFDRSGLSTAVILIIIGTAAFLLGLLFHGRSGWCCTFCPVHGVEKLYGQRNALTVVNAHCRTCANCVVFCPDKVSNSGQLFPPERTSGDPHTRISHFIVGGFPGYVYGWFQCPDLTAPDVMNALTTYAWPFAGMAISLIAYLFLLKTLRISQARLTGVFAALAISTYYWFRIPMLFGFGRFGHDGCLIDVSGGTPVAVIFGLQVSVILLIALWLVRGILPARPWTAIAETQ